MRKTQRQYFLISSNFPSVMRLIIVPVKAGKMMSLEMPSTVVMNDTMLRTQWALM